MKKREKAKRRNFIVCKMKGGLELYLSPKYIKQNDVRPWDSLELENTNPKAKIKTYGYQFMVHEGEWEEGEKGLWLTLPDEYVKANSIRAGTLLELDPILEEDKVLTYDHLTKKEMSEMLTELIGHGHAEANLRMLEKGGRLLKRDVQAFAEMPSTCRR